MVQEKSEQALQIIDHVVADHMQIEISVQSMGVDNLWSTLNESYLMNFRR
jgi:hypothetical protein